MIKNLPVGKDSTQRDRHPSQPVDDHSLPLGKPFPPPVHGRHIDIGLGVIGRLLADRLDTKVSISMTTRRGKVVIDFANLEDLERIYRTIISE